MPLSSAQRLRTWVAPLDALRSATLRPLAPLLAPWLRGRPARIALLGVLTVAFSLFAALREPLLLLTVSPLLLGVPHLLTDVRYLVVQPALHRRRSLQWLLAPLLLATALWPSTALAFTAIALSALLARAALTKRLAVAMIASTIAYVASRSGALAQVCFAHAHNLAALALWLLMARGPRLQVLPALALFVLGASVILGLPVQQLPLADGALVPTQLRIDAALLLSESSASSDPVLGLRLLLLFAFAQSVHYAVWTRLIPEEARARPAPRSFAASAQALLCELGAPLVCGFVGLSVYVTARGLLEPQATRALYMRFAYVHGPLELCAAVLLLLEGRRPWPIH